MSLKRCRICGSEDVVLRLHLPDLPCHIWPLADERKRVYRDADVYACGSCGHLQLQDLEAAFIESLYVHETCNLEDPDANRGRVRAVEDRFGSECFSGKRVLDIGGGRNAFSSFLGEGEKWICDLSVSRDLRRPGVRVVEGDFLEAELPSGYFDVIALFHTLEHLNDPAAAVARMAELLAPGGRVLIEVPNVPSVIRSMPYYAVFHQHISMFSSETLAFLFEARGLGLEHWFRTDNVLFAGFREGGDDAKPHGRPDPGVGEEMVVSLERRLEALDNALSELPLSRNRARVGLYGAGGSSALFLAHFPWLKDRIGSCYDRDSRKQGRFLPGTDIRIGSPEALPAARLEQLVFLSSRLHEVVDAGGAVETFDVEDLIRSLPA